MHSYIFITDKNEYCKIGRIRNKGIRETRQANKIIQMINSKKSEKEKITKKKKIFFARYQNI